MLTPALNRLLAIETSGQLASVCVALDGAVLAKAELLCPNRHHEVLLSLVTEALAGASLSLEALSALIVGLGPGGFTSVRAGLTTAKALALCTGLPLLGGSTLQALTLARGSRQGCTLSLLDARREELFCSLFEPDGASQWRCLAAPSLVPLRSLGAWVLAQPSLPTCCLGDLAGETLALAQGELLSAGVHAVWEHAIPSAPGLIALAMQGLAVRDDGALEPLYVRASDARLPAVAQRGGQP